MGSRGEEAQEPKLVLPALDSLTALLSSHSRYPVVAATSAAASASAAVATTSTIAGLPLPACLPPLLVQRLGCQPAQLGQEMQ